MLKRWHRHILAGVGVVVAGVVAIIVVATVLPHGSVNAPGQAVATLDPGLPDPILTPGRVNPDVTQATIGTTICVSGWTATVRPPASFTNAIKLQQMANGYHRSGSAAQYEEDHLIALELGGAPRDPLNLWPEPRSGTWPASKKDQLENTLKKDVCDGTITLATAQEAMRTDWIIAYQQYIHA